MNELLANSDAHLKNWSLTYADGRTPRLSPAYDVLTTQAYIPDEYSFALNLGTAKAWHSVTEEHFRHWASKADIPWRAIKPHLLDVMTRARDLWPQALNQLPIDSGHRRLLTEHWNGLQPDFRFAAA